MPVFECFLCKEVFRSTRRAPRPKYCSYKCFRACKTKDCRRCYLKAYHTKNRAKAAQTSRERRLRVEYGITEAQWQMMYELQGGKCPICGTTLHLPNNKEGKRAAAVDHDHKTGRIRGLVCHVCNRSRIGKNTAESAKRLTDFLSSDFDGRDL